MEKVIAKHAVVEISNIDYFLNQFLTPNFPTEEEQVKGILLTELKGRVGSIDPTLQTSYYRALGKLENAVKRALWGQVKEKSVIQLKISPSDQPEIGGAEGGQVLIAQTDSHGLLVSVTPETTKMDIVLKRSRGSTR